MIFIVYSFCPCCLCLRRFFLLQPIIELEPELYLFAYQYQYTYNICCLVLQAQKASAFCKYKLFKKTIYNYTSLIFVNGFLLFVFLRRILLQSIIKELKLDFHVFIYWYIENKNINVQFILQTRQICFHISALALELTIISHNNIMELLILFHNFFFIISLYHKSFYKAYISNPFNLK